MKDLKKIQEFFSKSLEEGKQLDIEDFAKVVQAVTKTGHPVTVLLTPKFNEIEVLTGTNAPDDMLRDLSIAVDSLGYGRNDIIIAGDSTNLSRREYSDIRRVNGGHKDYFEESVNEAEYTDYSNKELAAYCKNNPTDKKAAKELHKRSQALKNLSRTDVNEGGIEDIQKKLDALGVKYEMSKTDKVRPFKVIYKPVNKSDEFYDKFEDIVDLFNLKGFVKTSMDEATKDEENEFHKKLDKLVHKTFGHSSDEKKKEMNEAYVPSNIAEFAKRRGIAPLVRKVAGWAERVGARITGGTAIGYGYNTLILDLGYQTGDIRIDVEDETIELYDEPVYSFADFKNVFMEEVTRQQMEHDEEQLRRERGLEEKAAYIAETIKLGLMLNEELCDKGKRYIAARQAAGEKSSAYLSGRAVRVCKGQIEWPKKGKKK